jgi:hypothetical protein
MVMLTMGEKLSLGFSPPPALATLEPGPHRLGLAVTPPGGARHEDSLRYVVTSAEAPEKARR